MPELTDLCFPVVPSDYTFPLVIDKTGLSRAGNTIAVVCRNGFFPSLLDHSHQPCLSPAPGTRPRPAFQYKFRIMSDQERRSVGKFLLI